jgi:hypothetical protein
VPARRHTSVHNSSWITFDLVLQNISYRRSFNYDVCKALFNFFLLVFECNWHPSFEMLNERNNILHIGKNVRNDSLFKVSLCV